MVNSLETWKSRTEIPLLIVAIGSLPFLLLELAVGRLPDHDKALLIIVNLVVGLAFLIDFVVGISLAPSKSSYIKHEWVSLVIVIAQFIAILPSLAALGGLRALRVLRVIIAVARASAIMTSISRRGKSLLRKRAWSTALTIAGITWITSSVAFTLAEDVGENRRVGSFFDALWWSASTISTVGYGDVYPITTAGRVIAVFTMIIGISTFALVTAKIAQVLMSEN
jgi:voltage-gated potassium channel